ncbi:hypothetical protein Sm713_20490 [Streptomyces sp. TS71-3]|nr:hypothetical protein Sm713_20490 [Streptomyces sp. TS71-3]
MDIALITLRICLSPVLVLLMSAVQRHWGPVVGGRLAGLPLTSGPVVVLLLAAHGPVVAAQAAAGTLQGLLSSWGLSLAYAVAARHGRGRPASLLAALTVFAASTVLLWLARPALPVTLALIAVALTGTLLWRPPGTAVAAAPGAWWDLPLRMACAGATVLVLTSVSGVLGPRLSGLLTPIQAIALILALFTHRAQGGLAAAHFFLGVLQGFFACAAFFLVLALALPRWPSAAAVLLACGTAAAVQTLLPMLLARLPLRHGRPRRTRVVARSRELPAVGTADGRGTPEAGRGDRNARPGNEPRPRGRESACGRAKDVPAFPNGLERDDSPAYRRP